MGLIEGMGELAQKRWFKLLVAIVILTSIVLLGVFLYLVLSDNGEVLNSPKNATSDHLSSKNGQNTESLNKNDTAEVYNRKHSRMGHYHGDQKPKIELYSVWNNSLDESVDPCDDFYAFTCGNYMPNRQDDFDEDSADFKEMVIKVLQDIKSPSAKEQALPEVEKCLKEVVFGDKPSNSTAVAKMRHFRDSINNGLEGRTTKQMISQMKMIGGCPAVLGQDHFDENFDFVEALYNMKKFTGKSPLFTAYSHELTNGTFVFGIKPDNHTMTKPFAYLDSIGVVSDEFIADKQKLFYYLFKLAVKKVGKNMSDLDEIALELALLEQQVFQYVAEDEFQQDEDDSSEDSEIDPVDFEELDYYLPVINGTDYYMKIYDFMPEMISYLKGNPTVYLNNKNVLVSLNDFYGSMEKKTMANYLCAFYLIEQQKISRMENLLEEDPLAESSLFKRELSELQQEAAIDTLQHLFGLVTDYLYINECINSEDLKSVSKMADEIQQASLKMIEKQDWLDPLTKSRALQKLKSMKKIIGALDVAFDVQQLDDQYKLLDFNSQDNLHEIFAKVFLFLESNFFHEIVSGKKSIDIYRANEMNLINLLRENTIVIYAGNLYSPNFDSKRPDSLNYGAIGMMIGHEVWHTFKKNSTFDENGLKKDLWTPKSYEKFKERARCFVSQYDELEEIDSYGTKTLEENIADISGLKAAYYAYKERAKCEEKTSSVEDSSCSLVDGKPTKVPGYEKYSKDQSFFISYGTIWCINQLKMTQRILTDIDKHALNHYRVNEVLKNMPEFAKAFNCPLRSEMNPRHKCEMF